MLTAKEKNLSKLALINVLKKSTPEVRNRLFNYLNSEGIQVVSESVFNVLFNGAPLTKSQRRKIKKEYTKDKKILKELSLKRSSLKKKKRLLKQTGGFLGTLLGNTHVINEHKYETELRNLVSGIASSILGPLIFGHG